MKLGMPVLIELDDLQQNVRLCRRLGLQVLELSMNLPQYCPEVLPAADVRALAAEGLAVTLHLPEEADVATFHPQVRRAHIARAIEAIRWAGQAGIALLNMHINAGVYYTLPEGRVYVYEAQQHQFNERLIEGMEEMSAAAREEGITLCVENTGQFNLEFLVQPLQHMVDRGIIGLTWDTGHDGTAGFTDKPFIMRNLGSLRHMHLHDFDDKHNHLPVHTGNLDLAEALRLAIGLDLSVIVEVKTAPALERSVEAVRQSIGGMENRFSK